jgi:Na+-transporting NADH:ubiquinone oxidoreductase subunit NqrC
MPHNAFDRPDDHGYDYRLERHIMIIFILVFSLISSLLTFLATITFIVAARKHYKQIFNESFISFVAQLDNNKLSDENGEKYLDYVHTITLNGCSNLSIEKYLLDTHQLHSSSSKLYANAFDKLQHHKIKVFFTSLLG